MYYLAKCDIMYIVKNIELTQDEIRYIIASLDKLVSSGGLRLGDISIIDPLAQKLSPLLDPVVDQTPQDHKTPLTKPKN